MFIIVMTSDKMGIGKSLFSWLAGAFKRLEVLSDEFAPLEKGSVAEQGAAEQAKEAHEVHNFWDYLKFQENTQAHHLANILNFEEWLEMEEIRRRISELFGITYKNERSLYPYLKTLVDIGLVEGSNIGGRRKWRKKALLINFSELKKAREDAKKEKTAEQVARTETKKAEQNSESSDEGL